MSEGTSMQKRAHGSMVFSQPSSVENQVSRLYRAPVERVFRLFTDRATLPYVIALDPKTVNIETLDFWKGGKFAFTVKQSDGSLMRFHGEFREVDPPWRVVNTTELDAFPGAVTIETDEFEAVGDFTRVTVRWKFERQEDRDKMGGPESEKIITAMWDHMEDLLEKGPPTAVLAGA